MNKRRRYLAKRARANRKARALLKRIANVRRKGGEYYLRASHEHVLSSMSRYRGTGDTCAWCDGKAYYREIQRKTGHYVGACKAHVDKLKTIHNERTGKFEARAVHFADCKRTKDNRDIVHNGANAIAYRRYLKR
jgi:hypothetical protein